MKRTTPLKIDWMAIEAGLAAQDALLRNLRNTYDIVIDTRGPRPTVIMGMCAISYDSTGAAIRQALDWKEDMDIRATW